MSSAGGADYVLVIDDEMEMCNLRALALGDDGHEVACSTDPVASSRSAEADPGTAARTDRARPPDADHGW
jgi:hypothetical protein